MSAVQTQMSASDDLHGESSLVNIDYIVENTICPSASKVRAYKQCRLFGL